MIRCGFTFALLSYTDRTGQRTVTSKLVECGGVRSAAEYILVRFFLIYLSLSCSYAIVKLIPHARLYCALLRRVLRFSWCVFSQPDHASCRNHY